MRRGDHGCGEKCTATEARILWSLSLEATIVAINLPIWDVFGNMVVELTLAVVKVMTQLDIKIQHTTSTHLKAFLSSKRKNMPS